MTHFLNYSSNELESWLAEQGWPRFRRAQIERWVFARRAADFDQMSDLPKALRAQLAGAFELSSVRQSQRRSTADGTEKLLLTLADGQQIESVLIREGRRRTVCLSTQVGCAMGCAFCASGLDGVARNLTSGEIVEQMLTLARLLPPQERLSHLVVMGMGEPLANLRSLLPALARATDPSGLGISARRITISTVGLPAGIHRLAEHNVPYHLAISLHAPDDALRSRLVPVNAAIGMDAILAAADAYFAATGRRVTYEYVLLAGVNDSPEQARRLAARLAGRCALVNLIPFNPVSETPFATPAASAVEQFVACLSRGGIEVQVRRRKGDRIDAACGQLRRRAAQAAQLATTPAG